MLHHHIPFLTWAAVLGVAVTAVAASVQLLHHHLHQLRIEVRVATGERAESGQQLFTRGALGDEAGGAGKTS